jgi:hypothetical protein
MFAVSGRILRVFSFRRRARAFTPRPLLSSPYSSPRSTTTYQLAPHAHARPPLLRFRPLQRSTETGVRIPRRFQPPAPSVLRVSHPLDVLLRLQPWPACFIRPALLGFHRVQSLAPAFRPMQGETAPGLPLQSFLRSRDDRLVDGLLSCTPLGAPAKERFGDFTSREGSKAAQQMLHSLDHRNVGVSRGSEPRAPAFLRFAADRPHS